jgi:hypothetical protein
MHYTPDNGLYVYFRYDAKQTIMCIMNTADTLKQINFSNYAERTNGFSSCIDVITGQQEESGFFIPAKRMIIAVLKK